MITNISSKKSPVRFGLAVMATAFASFVVVAQDIVNVDIGGGAGVFHFPRGARSVAKKFVAPVRARRTKTERIETSKKVTGQYAKLIKVTPRRTRTASVDPNDPRTIAQMKDIPRMDKTVASRLFAGVGEFYMDRDNYDQAIDVFRESLDLDKTNAVARNGLSEALALKGNKLLAADSFPVAQKFFEEALLYNDKNAPAYFGLAEVLTEMDKGAEAAANYEKALQFDKELTEIYVPLGILYYQAGITAQPNDAAKIANAQSLLTKAIAIDANDAQSQYYMGLVLANQGNDKAALANFNKAKMLDPKMAEAFMNAGEANSRLNQNREAVVDLEKAIALRPNYFEALFALGSAYFELGEWQKSIDTYEKAKRLKNDNAEVVANLGDVYRQSGDFNKAESNYNLAGLFFERQKDFATNKETREIAAETYAKVGFAIAKQCEKNTRTGVPCKWNAAVTALEKATSISPNPTYMANLGWALQNAGKSDIVAGNAAAGKAKLERSSDVLKKVIAGNPAQIEAPLLNLGMAQTDLGDFKGAIETFKKVIAKEPKWVFARNELGIAYLNDGNTKEAISQFKEAVKRDDKFAPAYFNLAKAEFKNGNLGEAKKAHSKLKSLGRPDLAVKLEVETGGVVRS